MSQNHVNPLPVADYWLLHAVQNIQAQYGHKVSILAKNKDLFKFGHNLLVGTALATVEHQHASILQETFVSDNLINSIISSSTADTQVVKVEGYTINGSGDFIFDEQEVTLTGRTVVALDVPLARVTRVYNNDVTNLVGIIHVTETDTYSAGGIPDTPAKIHLMIIAGEQQSDKCSTTVASSDYLILTGFSGEILEKTAAFVEIVFQIRLKDKVFRNRYRIAASRTHEFKPYFIVPPNSDIRLAAIADGTGTQVAGGIQGVLARIES